MAARREKKRSFGRTAADVAVGVVTDVARGLGDIVESAFRTPVDVVRRGIERARPGAAPGIEHLPEIDVPPPPEAVRIRCIDFGADAVRDVAVTDLEAFLDAPRPADAPVRWIDIEGLNPYVVNRFRERFGFHTLAAEDVLHVPQRPKVETHADHVFVTGQMLSLSDTRVDVEQVSLFLYEGVLLTFQERHGDVWEPVRERIHADGSRVRRRDASYLLYALLDAVVDHCFPLMERFGDLLEDMEDVVVARPEPATLQRLHAIKRDLVAVRRILWPTRELVASLGRNEEGRIADETVTYLRDVNDHATQLIDIVETYREMAGGLTDLYMSAVSNKMNEVMKVLTIMASFFIPITFIAGVYGMNFEHMPELSQPWAYPVFWGVCAAVTLGLLVFFRRKGWLGGGRAADRPD